jgi:hypothetical protein
MNHREKAKKHQNHHHILLACSDALWEQVHQHGSVAHSRHAALNAVFRGSSGIDAVGVVVAPTDEKAPWCRCDAVSNRDKKRDKKRDKERDKVGTDGEAARGGARCRLWYRLWPWNSIQG